MLVDAVRKELKSYARKDKAVLLQRFFKTGPGEYGEGDIFLGITVPEIRKTVKKYYRTLKTGEIGSFVRSGFHEERLFGLLVLVYKYPKSENKEGLYNFYLRNIKFVNNWDLVDLTAPHIVGAFLADKEKQPLYVLARGGSIWERRVAVLATFYYIRNSEFEDALNIAKILLKDKEDLIHKATGWMLREVGKREMPREEAFLKKHYKIMPRTMLRYAIEKFPENKRQKYLKGRV